MKEAVTFLEKKLQKNDVVVLGCSGGPDSMCLLNLLLEYRKKTPITIVCAHVNHKVRKVSDKEYKFVADYCAQNDVIFEGMEIDTYSQTDNFHNEARTKRYQFFESCLQKYNAHILMTAHHGDDLMETILMRIARGSTLKGYAGFAKEREKDFYTLLRPLIYLTKEEIEMYDKENNIPYVKDQSNDTDHYTRNRYRHHILPFFKKEDAKVHQKFLKFSEELLEYHAYVENLLSKKIEEVYRDQKLFLEEFHKLDKLLQTKVVEYVLNELYEDDLFLIGKVHTDLILQLANTKKANTYVMLPNHMIARKTYNEITFEKEESAPEEYCILLTDEVLLPNGHQIKMVTKKEGNHSNYCMHLCSEDVALPLYIRTKKEGDKMCVKNLSGTKKVKDIFIDCKIPKKDRDLYPILVDSKGQILWIPGVKKSIFDKDKDAKYDIIVKYI